MYNPRLAGRRQSSAGRPASSRPASEAHLRQRCERCGVWHLGALGEATFVGNFHGDVLVLRQHSMHSE
jgi:hypothetical protein